MLPLCLSYILHAHMLAHSTHSHRQRCMADRPAHHEAGTWAHTMLFLLQRQEWIVIMQGDGAGGRLVVTDRPRSISSSSSKSVVVQRKPIHWQAQAWPRRGDTATMRMPQKATTTGGGDRWAPTKHVTTCRPTLIPVDWPQTQHHTTCMQDMLKRCEGPLRVCARTPAAAVVSCCRVSYGHWCGRGLSMGAAMHHSRLSLDAPHHAVHACWGAADSMGNTYPLLHHSCCAHQRQHAMPSLTPTLAAAVCCCHTLLTNTSACSGVNSVRSAMLTRTHSTPHLLLSLLLSQRIKTQPCMAPNTRPDVHRVYMHATQHAVCATTTTNKVVHEYAARPGFTAWVGFWLGQQSSLV